MNSETTEKPAASDNLNSLVSHVKDCYGRFVPMDDDTIADGLGCVWSAWCPICGWKEMQVVRPGKVQCGNCC